MIGNTGLSTMRTTPTITQFNYANKTMKKKTTQYDPSSEASPLYDEFLEITNDGFSKESAIHELRKGKVQLAWKLLNTIISEEGPFVVDSVFKEGKKNNNIAVYIKHLKSNEYQVFRLPNSRMDDTDLYYINKLFDVQL
jgi:hypothetical protein